MRAAAAAAIGADGMTAGRIGGVIELLLQRLTVLASYLPESLAEDYSVDACVAGISARIKTRAPVAERTVRRWTESAKELGLLSVRYMSQEYGGHKWNCYTVHFSTVLAMGDSGRTRADTGGQNVRPLGRTKCPALRADKMSAPLNVFNVQESTHSLTLNASTSGGEQKLPVDKTEVVVSALVGMSMSEDGSRKAVHRALTRGLTFAEIDELIERYQRLAQTDTRMTGRLALSLAHRAITPTRAETDRRATATSDVRPSRIRASSQRGDRCSPG